MLMLTNPRDAFRGSVCHQTFGMLGMVSYQCSIVTLSLRNSTCKLYSDLETWVRGSLKVIGTDTDRCATYDFQLTFHSNHGPISHRFRDKRRFQSNITKLFSHPRVFCAHADGVPLGIRYRHMESRNQNHGAIGSRKKFDDLFSHLDTIHKRDRQKGGRTDTGRQQDRAYAQRRAVKINHKSLGPENLSFRK